MFLAPRDQHVAVEPSLIQRLPFAVGHALDVKPGHQRADIRNRILDFHALPLWHGRTAARQQQFGGMMLTEPVGIVPPMPAAASSASSGSSGLRICVSAWSRSRVSSCMATILVWEVATLTPAGTLFKICRTVQLDQALPD